MRDGGGLWQMIILRKRRNMDVGKERGSHEAHPPPPHADSSDRRSYLAPHHARLRETGFGIYRSHVYLQYRTMHSIQIAGVCSTTKQRSKINYQPFHTCYLSFEIMSKYRPNAHHIYRHCNYVAGHCTIACTGFAYAMFTSMGGSAACEPKTWLRIEPVPRWWNLRTGETQ